MKNGLSNTQSLLIVLSSVLVFMVEFANAEDLNYQKLSLKEGIKIEVPKHWYKHSEAEKLNFAASSEAGHKIAGLEYEGGDEKIRVLAVSSLPMPSAAKIRINVLRPVGMTSANLVLLTTQDIKKLQVDFTADATKSLSAAGMKLLSLEIPRIETINGNPALCFDYRRTDQRVPSPWIVRHCEIPAGDKSIQFSTSYRESEAVIYKTILDYVKQSLRLAKQ